MGCLLRQTHPKIGIRWPRLAGLWKKQPTHLRSFSKIKLHVAFRTAPGHFPWKWGKLAFMGRAGRGRGQQAWVRWEAYGTLFLTLRRSHLWKARGGPGVKQNRKKEGFAIRILGVNWSRGSVWSVMISHAIQSEVHNDEADSWVLECRREIQLTALYSDPNFLSICL